VAELGLGWCGSSAGFAWGFFVFLFCFFFQAEDGIRDSSVTGVQTLLFRSDIGHAPDAADVAPVEVRGEARFGVVRERDRIRLGEIGRASCRKECAGRWRLALSERKEMSTRWVR